MKKKKVFIRHLALYLHVSVVFPVVVCVVVMGTVQRWWSFPIPERSLCFAILCCPGWAGHDSPSSVRLRPTSMPAPARGDHSPLTFSEGEEAKRDRRVERTFKKKIADCEGARKCVRGILRGRRRLQTSRLESHTHRFSLSGVGGVLPADLPSRWMGESMCVCLCVCAWERGRRQVGRCFICFCSSPSAFYHFSDSLKILRKVN